MTLEKGLVASQMPAPAGPLTRDQLRQFVNEQEWVAVSDDLCWAGQVHGSQRGEVAQPLAAAFSLAPAWTFTPVDAGMETDSPVCGLRPTRAARCAVEIFK